MTKTFNSFLLGATAIAAFGATATLTAFSAPQPDAPQIVTPKPKPVTVIPVRKKAPARTRVIIRRADRAVPTGLKVVVIDEPNVQAGTISVVTEQNEFATIATGMGTRIARGYQLASLGNIHPGYTLRCQGAWDQDGFQYQANRIALGETIRDTDVIARVNAACENIGKARKGGGFGQAQVAIAPPAVSRAVSVGGTQPAPTPPAAPASPVPEELIPSQPSAPMPATSPAMPPAPEPANGVPAPNEPATVPAPPQNP